MFKLNKFDRHYDKGQKFILKEKIPEARDEFLKCLAIKPDDLGVLNNLAQLSNYLGEKGKAEGYNELLLKECNKQLKYEKNERLLTLKSNALFALEKTEEANKIIDELLEINPENTIGLLQKSLYHENNKDYQKALSNINQILKNNPKSMTSLLRKGKILTEMNEYDAAEECFNMVFEINPKNMTAAQFKSEMLKKRYNLTLTPHDFLLKALKHWEMEKFKASEDYLKKALEIDDKYDEIWFVQGELFIRTGKINDAITSFKKAFELNPKSGGVVDKKEFFKLLNRMLKINKLLGYEK